jgi:hypothetical protein
MANHRTVVPAPLFGFERDRPPEFRSQTWSRPFTVQAGRFFHDVITYLGDEIVAS